MTTFWRKESMGLFLICTMLVAFKLTGQDAGEDRTTDGDVTELLGKGILAEETDHPAEALSYYQQALNAFEQYRESAAAAVFRMAETYRKLGDERAAREHYRRIVGEFADFDEFARKSREYLKATRNKAEPSLEKNANSGDSGNSISLSDALKELELERSIALSAAIENESLLKALKQKKGEDLVKTVSFMTPGAQLPKLIQERYKVDRQLAGLDIDFSPHNPNIKRWKALRSEISEQIVEEVNAITQGLEVQAEASRERVKEIDAAIQRAKTNEDSSLLNPLGNAQGSIEPIDPMQLKFFTQRLPEEEVVIVGGAVKRPSVIALPKNGRRVGIVEAIAAAGGFDKLANKNKIELIRSGKKTTYGYDDLKTSVSDDVQVQDKDQIFVRESFF